VALAGNFNRSFSEDCSSLAFPIGPGETVYAHLFAQDDATLFTASYALEVVYTPIACGNGAVDTGEECDDGNPASGDGCSSLCRLEPVCGDGAIMTGEQCDDGNTTAGDGCGATCQVELVDEVEPNDSLAQAIANPVQIAGDTYVRGSLTGNQFADLYRVTVTTGTVVRLETFSTPGDCQGGNVDLQLLDAAGAVLREDYVGDGILGCSAVVAFLQPGTYFIKVYRGSAQPYFLEVDFQTNRGSEPESPGTSGANDTLATTSTNLVAGNDVFVSGNHTQFADSDFYAITVLAGGRIRARILEGTDPSETCAGLHIDARLTLYDQNGAVLADDGFYCATIDGTGLFPSHPGARNASGVAQTYYLQVRTDASSPSYPNAFFNYRLQLTIR
jgi:cysteine-rich repeat protein